MTKQIELWKSEFGDEYAKRNAITEEITKARERFWLDLLKNIYFNTSVMPESVLEIGAGTGPNLMALDNVYNQMQRPLKRYATEINDKTREILKFNVPGVEIIGSKDLDKQKIAVADLCYTYGVLIHVHPAHRIGLMRDIYNCSKRFILCAEYFAPELRSIPYRGETDALWLDDYGKVWLDNFKLRVVNYGFMWRKITGLDNVTYWVFEKVN